jgi:hypothetical protein
MYFDQSVVLYVLFLRFLISWDLQFFEVWKTTKMWAQHKYSTLEQPWILNTFRKSFIKVEKKKFDTKNLVLLVILIRIIFLFSHTLFLKKHISETVYLKRTYLLISPIRSFFWTHFVSQSFRFLDLHTFIPNLFKIRRSPTFFRYKSSPYSWPCEQHTYKTTHNSTFFRCSDR